jgi:hypothetical protein
MPDVADSLIPNPTRLVLPRPHQWQGSGLNSLFLFTEDPSCVW